MPTLFCLIIYKLKKKQQQTNKKQKQKINKQTKTKENELKC